MNQWNKSDSSIAIVFAGLATVFALIPIAHDAHGAQGQWQFEGSRTAVGRSISDPKSGMKWDGWTYTQTDRYGKSAGCRLGWTKPPQRLDPGKAVDLKFNVELIDDQKHEGNPSCQISAYLADSEDGRASVSFFRESPRQPTAQRGVRKLDEVAGRAPVREGRSAGQKLYLAISATMRGTESAKSIYFAYSWVPGSAPGGAGAAPSAPSRSASSAPSGGGISQEITGIWTSNYGDVSFTGSNRSLGGTWNQPQGRGQITGGQYDPQTKRLVFYYTQSWNKMNGRADLTLSGSGSGIKLAGGWKQWPIGKTEADVARTGSWTMSKK